MQITASARAELFEIKLKGRMDANWSDHVARFLAESVQSGQHLIALDMAEVEYISSAGIRVLVLHARQLKSIQGSFSVVNPSDQVRKVLELSGLGALLFAPKAVPAAQVDRAAPARVRLTEAAATAEMFDLEPEAALHMDWPGHPERWLAGAAGAQQSLTVTFPTDAIGIGLGGFGNGQPDEAPQFGEFLAAAGAAVCLPSDGSHNPDYVLQQAELIPSLKVAYGMCAAGGFRSLVRFDKGPQQQSLSFSSIVKACLQANGGKPAGLVMVAETASLTGVSLQKVPAAVPGGAPPSNPFAFPKVRDWLSFTTEPAFPNTTCLVVGFAATQAGAAGLRLLKPLVRSGEIQGHFHAAVFPYQPLRKGKVDLGETVRSLFESGQILGLLHLLNDWREINGAGESRFLRGACWFSPLLASKPCCQ